MVSVCPSDWSVKRNMFSDVSPLSGSAALTIIQINAVFCGLREVLLVLIRRCGVCPSSPPRFGSPTGISGEHEQR